MSQSESEPPPRAPHPILFTVLMFPFGAMGGYVSVAVAYDLGRQGVSAVAIAALIAIGFVPHTWKFLWAPVVDTTWTPRAWYLASALISAAGVVAIGAIPAARDSLPLLDAVVLLANLAVTFNGMSVEYLVAHCAPPQRRGAYGGWLQVGNLAGVGVGGGAALWLSQVLPERWMAGCALGISFVLCALALQGLPAIGPASHDLALVRRFREVVRDCWAIARSRSGALAILILFLPLGTGAASGLWSAVAGDWKASVNTVALVNGVLGGVMAGLGCVLGGYLADLMDRKLSYGVFALAQAACAVAMAVAPRTETSYIVFTLLYAITTGLTYASFSAVTLEAIGLGAAATKYNLLASLSNVPIQYMIVLDGYVHDAWGAGAMLAVEAAICVAAVGAFAGIARITGGRRAPPLPASGVV
jgi:MFS family permease